MKTVRQKTIKSTLTRIFSLTSIAALLLAAAFCFTACDSGSQNTQQDVYALYFLGYDYSPADKTIIGYVALNGEESQRIKDLNADRAFSSKADGTMYNVGTTVYSVPSSSLYSAADAMIPPEARIKDGIEYSDLKVNFRYVTIYKSIKVDADTTRSGRYYVHTRALDENAESEDIVFVRRLYNAANWYSALIGAALGAVVIGLCAYLAVSGVKCRKK